MIHTNNIRFSCGNNTKPIYFSRYCFSPFGPKCFIDFFGFVEKINLFFSNATFASVVELMKYVISTVSYFGDKYSCSSQNEWWSLDGFSEKDKRTAPPLTEQINFIYFGFGLVFNWKFHPCQKIKRFAPLIRRLTQMVSELKNNVPNFQCEPGQAEHFRKPTKIYLWESFQLWFIDIASSK